MRRKLHKKGQKIDKIEQFVDDGSGFVFEACKSGLSERFESISVAFC